MPSAYLVMHDDMGNYMISKKRITNRWWQGALAPAATAVNQAGQFGLPGGGINPAESAYRAAVREFHEESGVDLRAGGEIDTVELVRNHHYVAVDVEVSPQRLRNLCQTANANVQPAPANAETPAGPVRDWEHAEFRIVRGANICKYLGTGLYVIPAHRAAIAQRPAHSQAIDWYRAIGLVIEGQCQP